MSEHGIEGAPPDGLWLVTIYAHPDDYPEGFVVRRTLVPPPPAPGIAAEPVPSVVGYHCASLEAARRLARELGGSIPLPRLPGDVPCIVETWV